MEAIARLDAELIAAAAASLEPSVSTKQRVGFFAGGLLGGWMFGGAIAGPAGIVYCTALGAFAGGYRAYTGRPLAEIFQGRVRSGSSMMLQAQGSGMSNLVETQHLRLVPVPMAVPVAGGCGKPAC